MVSLLHSTFDKMKLLGYTSCLPIFLFPKILDTRLAILLRILPSFPPAVEASVDMLTCSWAGATSRVLLETDDSVEGRGDFEVAILEYDF